MVLLCVTVRIQNCNQLLMIITIAVDCGPLSSPDNGNVNVGDTTLGNKATYYCEHGYVLVGPDTRKCLYTGYWSEYEPVCERKKFTYSDNS